MLGVIKVIMFIIAISLFIITLYLLYVSLGYRKNNLCKTRGYLEKVTHHRNYYFGKHYYKNYSEYLYVYRVDGKEYHIDGGFSGKPDGASRTVNIMYQRNKPKHAYIHRMGIPIEPILCGFALILSLIFFGITTVV